MALHLVAIFFVIVFAGGRHGTHSGVVGVDISQLSARPRTAQPRADAPRDEAKRPRSEVPPEAGAIPIPTGDAAETAPPPAPAAAQEAAQEAEQEASSEPLPAILDDAQSLQGDGAPPEPNAYQAFINAIYRRLDEATARSWRYAGAMAQMGIVGGEYHFHVLIGLDGQSPEVQFIPEKTSVLFNSTIDPQTADRHIRRFFDLVTADIRAGVPYPEAPPRVPLKPFCYSIRASFPGAKLGAAPPPG